MALFVDYKQLDLFLYKSNKHVTTSRVVLVMEDEQSVNVGTIAYCVLCDTITWQYIIEFIY